MKTVVLLTMWILAFAGPAYAQHPDVIELQGGGGYVFGSGTEAPGPSLPTLDAAVVIWPSARWGFGVRLVEAPGEDLYAVPVEIPDRTFLGVGHLHYWTMSVRHRRQISRDFGVEIGIGIMFGEKFADIEMLRDPPRRVLAANGPTDGLSLDAFVTRSLARHFSLKGGVSYDFVVETNHLHPVVLVAVRF